jgi:hypothetical protein
MVHNPITQVVYMTTHMRVFRVRAAKRYTATARNKQRVDAATSGMHRDMLYGGWTVIDVRPELNEWGPTYEEMRPILASQREQDEQQRESREQAASDGLWRRGWD